MSRGRACGARAGAAACSVYEPHEPCQGRASGARANWARWGRRRGGAGARCGRVIRGAGARRARARTPGAAIARRGHPCTGAGRGARALRPIKRTIAGIFLLNL